MPDVFRVFSGCFGNALVHSAHSWDLLTAIGRDQGRSQVGVTSDRDSVEARWFKGLEVSGGNVGRSSQFAPNF